VSSGLRKEVKKLVREAQRQGCTVRTGRRPHYKLTCPGGTVTLSSSPSSQGAIKNMRADLRRVGIVLNPDPGDPNPRARRVKLHITYEEIDGNRGVVTFDNAKEAGDWLDAYFPADYRRDELSDENRDDLDALIQEARLGFDDWKQRADGRLDWHDGQLRLDWGTEPYEPTGAEIIEALAYINRARKQAGQSGLDPTGWGPGDIVTEAERLGWKPQANPKPYPKRSRPIMEHKERKQAQTQARMLAFLLEHGRSKIRGGHVALAKGLARRELVRVVRLRPGYAAEIAPGKEDAVLEAAKRKLLAW
jgi:hypothetical protein